MYSLLFDIRQEIGRMRVTVRLACLISRKGHEVYYTDSSDSVFTSGLLQMGIGRVFYPGDLQWFSPDITLLDLMLRERVAVYRQYGIECLLVTVHEGRQSVDRDAGILCLPPSPYAPLSKGARETDFIERLEEIREGRSTPVIVGILESEDGYAGNGKQAYKAIRRYGEEHPEYQFVVLTNQEEPEEWLFALPDNIAVYRPQDLQSLLPLCDLALVSDDRNVQTECTFAHLPALVLSPRELRRLTPHKLGSRITDMLNNRECLVEQQKTLCRLYEQENLRLDGVADRLIRHISDIQKQKL